MKVQHSKRVVCALVVATAMLIAIGSEARAANTASTTSLQLLSSTSQFQYSVQTVPLNAVVTGSPIGPLPSGKVTFYDQNGAIGSTMSLVAVHNFAYIASASFSTNALSVGSHSTHSVYSGDSYY